jgi:hypothetical protein
MYGMRQCPPTDMQIATNQFLWILFTGSGFRLPTFLIGCADLVEIEDALMYADGNNLHHWPDRLVQAEPRNQGLA